LKELVRRTASPETRQVAIEYLRLAYQLYPEDVMEVFSMSKDFPTVEENIRVIFDDLGAERIARAITDEQVEIILPGLLQRTRPQEIAEAITAEEKNALLRALLLERFSSEKVESILNDDGKRKL